MEMEKGISFLVTLRIKSPLVTLAGSCFDSIARMSLKFNGHSSSSRGLPQEGCLLGQGEVERKESG